LLYKNGKDCYYYSNIKDYLYTLCKDLFGCHDGEPRVAQNMAKTLSKTIHLSFRTNLFRLSIAFLLLWHICLFTGDTVAADKETKMNLGVMTTYDRIVSAQHMGEISSKESVMVRAKLLFAPNLLHGTRFAPREGERQISDSLTGFYKDVHRVFPQLSYEEKQLLSSFNPDLRAIIDQNQKENDKKTPSQGR
jgi:hypothetical protein